MSDEFDILKRASRSLRDETEPKPEDLHRLRARVMEGVRVQKRRRSRLWTAVFPIAAVLVATTAWAAGTGRLGAAMRGLRALFVPSEPVATAPVLPIVKSAPPVAPTPQPSEPQVEASAVNAPASVEPPVVLPPASAPVVIASAPKPSSTASAVNEPPPPVQEIEDAGSVDLSLYKHAHKLHFVDKDHAAALVAWDDYLARSPGGAFVAEAKYNRAICLVKLGRKAEAKAALQPFADGNVAGGYHKDDARKLIEALEAP